MMCFQEVILMSGAVLFLIAAILCAFWNVATSIRVANELQKRGENVSWIWLRVMAPVYAHRLRKIELAESGRIGTLYGQWVVSINLALVLGIAALVVHLI
jgi:hypothetical protein